MKVSEIVKRVRDTAGDAAVNQFSNETLTNWINDAIFECAVENSLLQKTASSPLVVDQAEYSLPTDIYKLHSVTVDNVEIQTYTLEEWRKRADIDPESSTASGTPSVGYVWANKLTLFPPPSVALSLKIYYTSTSSALAFTGGPGGDITWQNLVPAIPEIYHRRIVTYCLAQVALQDDDHNKYLTLMDEFKTGVVNQKHAIDSQEDLYPFVSVSPRDGGTIDWREEW